MHRIDVHSQDNPRALQTPFGSGPALETLNHDARVSHGALHAGHTTQLTCLILPTLCHSPARKHPLTRITDVTDPLVLRASLGDSNLLS